MKLTFGTAAVACGLAMWSCVIDDGTVSGTGDGGSRNASGGSGNDDAGGGAGASGASGGEGGGGASGAGGAAGGLFSAPEPWARDVSGLDPDARSDAIISTLAALGGWGHGNTMQIDFSLSLLWADASTPRQSITAAPDYCWGGSDCEDVPMDMPLPADGNTEGSDDYSCNPASNDCHVLVVERDEHRLYELYNATQTSNGFTALGAFVWDLDKAYPDNGRGDQCTSADAAGLPIAGLLVTADEVASGEVSHALRFILPNNRMKADVYVHPASHAGGPSSDAPDAPPYGVRFRLKADFDESGYSEGEKVVIHALQKYGMLLSDGGDIALTFADDRYTTAKWDDVGISAQSFGSLEVSDFEVVDLGPEIDLTYDCVRNP